MSNVRAVRAGRGPLLLPRTDHSAEAATHQVAGRSDWRSYLVSLDAIPERALATVQAASGRQASIRGALPLRAMTYDRGREALEIVLGADGNGSPLRYFVPAPTTLHWLPATGREPAWIAIDDADGERTLVRVCHDGESGGGR
jgi:hypothetical protein